MNNRKTIWEQLVDQKEKWIGGKFSEHDPMFGRAEGIIADMSIEKIEQNGTAWTEFRVTGAPTGKHVGFSCNIEYFGFSGGTDVGSGKLYIYGTFGGASSFTMEPRQT